MVASPNARRVSRDGALPLRRLAMARRLQVEDERTDPLQRFATGRRLQAERKRAEPLLLYATGRRLRAGHERAEPLQRFATDRRLQAGRERDYLLTDLQNGSICRQGVNKPNPCSVLRQRFFPPPCDLACRLA